MTGEAEIEGDGAELVQEEELLELPLSEELLELPEELDENVTFLTLWLLLSTKNRLPDGPISTPTGRLR